MKQAATRETSGTDIVKTHKKFRTFHTGAVFLPIIVNKYNKHLQKSRKDGIVYFVYIWIMDKNAD